MRHAGDSYHVCGREFDAAEIALIRDVVATCAGLSRRELANTISELVGWTRPGGSLKAPECLARLAADGLLTLPAKQPTKPVGSATSIPHTPRGEPGAPLTGPVETYGPVQVERVRTAEARRLSRELASTTLALGLRHLAVDWAAQYGVTPLLVETLVDPARYTGGCYRAANWIAVGETTGRGRDDPRHARHGTRPKRVWVYPLACHAVARLRGRG
jgi:hypothetical protein